MGVTRRIGYEMIISLGPSVYEYPPGKHCYPSGKRQWQDHEQ